jgi:sodium-dependent phosphate cotransporter
VVTLKGLVLARLEQFFDRTLFRNAALAMVFGLCLTVMVQSSSITTSLAVPLAGAGVLTLRQIFPYTLGANIGTTVTAILAALSVGNLAALSVSFAHLIFNALGVIIIWPIPALRAIPMRMAESFAAVSADHRWIPIAYVIVFFYVLPFAVIAILR